MIYHCKHFMLWKFVLLLCVEIAVACNNLQPDSANSKLTEEVTKDEKKENLLKRLKGLNELLEKHPKDAALLAERANIYYLLGDSLNCFKDIQNAINLKPSDADFLYLKGFYAYNYDLVDTALYWLKLSYNTLFQNPDVVFYIGNCYFLKNEFEEAKKWYFKALEKEENPNYYHALALVDYKQKQIPLSEQNLLKALQKDSLHAKSLSLLAEVYIYHYKQYNKAYEWIQKLLKQEHLPVGNYLEGSLYFQKALERKDSIEKEGLLRLAIDSYSKAIKKDPFYSNAFYDRGYAFFLLHRYDLASESFEEVLKLNPKDYRAAFMLGSIAEYYQDYDAAKKYYELCLKINPHFKDAEIALKELR